jgi:AraC-like DNA-binding protein
MITPSRDYAVGYCIIFFVGVVAYFSFMQPDIFSGKRVLLAIKYKNNGLPSSYAIEMKNKLVSLMELDKLFLDNSLTLDVLSDRLNLSRHHTSQLINEYFKVNFFEFVNNYRIAEAIKLLQDEKSNLNINQIIYTVGFNNRTSFYNVFKKKTGISPKSYRNKSKSTS